VVQNYLALVTVTMMQQQQQQQHNTVCLLQKIHAVAEKLLFSMKV